MREERELERGAARARLAGLLWYLPDLARTVYRLSRDPRVSAMDKTLLAGAVLYCINPFDLMPDAIPFLGQVDDIYLVALSLIRILARAHPEVLREHWGRREEIVPLVRELADLSALFLPRKLRDLLAANSGRWKSQSPA